MVVNDYGKMIVLIVITVGLIFLQATNSIEDTTFVGGLGVILGYVTGNGVNAVRKSAPSAVLTTSQQRLDDDAAAVDAA